MSDEMEKLGGPSRESLARALFEWQQGDNQEVKDFNALDDDHEKPWYFKGADMIIALCRKVEFGQMTPSDLVACPNCGQEQQRLATIGTEEYTAVCGPTCGCGHRWTVYPDPTRLRVQLTEAAPAYTSAQQRSDDELIRELVRCAETHALSGDGYSVSLNAAEQALRERLRGAPDNAAPTQLGTATHEVLPRCPHGCGATFVRLDEHFCGTARNAPALSSCAPLPDAVFDGYEVLQALDDKAKQRTSAENVADVLDALARVMRNAPAFKAGGQ